MPEFRRVRAPLLAAGLLLLFKSAYLSSVSRGDPQQELQSSAPDPTQTGREQVMTWRSVVSVRSRPPASVQSPEAVRSRPPAPVQPAEAGGGPGQRLVLLWTDLGGADDSGPDLGGRPFEGCPVSSCVTSSDRADLARADAVLFSSGQLNEDDLPLLRRPEQKFVFFARESPQLTKLNLTKLDGFFNLTMTYRRDADIYQPFGETVVGAQTEDLNDFQQRKPAAVMMTSTCKAPSQRENYARELGKYIFVRKVGPCGQQDCDSSVETCYRRQAADSLFALAFESSLCEDFITDQFWVALRAGLVPVVRGPGLEAYRRVAPPNSFIHVQQFGGPHGLAARLLALSRNRTAYAEYHAWRATHRVRRSPWNGCDLCADLWKDPGGGSRSVRLSESWAPSKHCSRPTDLATEFFTDRVLKLKTRLRRRA